MRFFFFLLLTISLLSSIAQPFLPYHFFSFEKTLILSKQLNNQRSAVIFSVPIETGEFDRRGEYEKMIHQAHEAFITMGIDAVVYLNNLNLVSGSRSLNSYLDILQKREIRNVIFLTKKETGYEILIAPFSDSNKFIKEGSDVFYLENQDLNALLLKLGKEVRRAELEKTNFLIPENPYLLEGISIVENRLLKNYPGILRRSKLAVERYTYLDSTNVEDVGVLERIRKRNEELKKQNQKLEAIMNALYPYEWEMINAMSDDDLKRNRYQFVLRCVSGSAKSVRQMLDYEVLPTETDFISVLPVMPDQKRVKILPKEAIVHKFFIRQNISKNVHAGEWDADVSWQEALHNMIGNLFQELNVGN